MSPVPRQACALALVALLLPLAAAQPQPPTVAPSCTAPVEDCFPDLIPMNPRAANTDERYPTTLCTDFTNIGRGAVVTPFRVLLSVDGFSTSDRGFSKQYQTGQGENNVCWDDIQLLGGRHSISIYVDSGENVLESDEKNNERTVNFTIKFAPQVDLRIKKFDILPREGRPNENQVFAVTVVNGGTKQSAASTVELTDPNGAIANLTILPIAPGAERTVAHVTRPDLRPVGTFVARAVVDPLGENSELNELNNDAYAEYTVLDHPTADLIITNVEVSGSREEFRGLLVNVTVQNIGDRSVRGNFVRAFNESGHLVGEAATAGTIQPNGTNAVQLRLVLRAGARHIDLVVDPLNEVVERNETNNAKGFEVTIVTPAIIAEEPNLIIERIFAMPDRPAPGEIVSVGALVRNIGTNRSVMTLLNFSIDGKPLNSTRIPPLGRELSHTGYVPWPGTTAGLHTITVTADGPDLVTEIDEGDNSLTLEFFVGNIEEETEPEPEPAPTPPVNVTPAPVTPTPTPPNSVTPTPNTTTVGPRVAIGDFLLEPRAIPGGVKGIISVTLRNPNLEPVGLVTAAFRVDGTLIKEILVGGIPSAATRSATSGEVNLPAGSHTVSVEVRVVGSSEPSLVREKSYDMAAGAKEGVPAAPTLLVALVAVAVALARRRPN